MKRFWLVLIAIFCCLSFSFGQESAPTNSENTEASIADNNKDTEVPSSETENSQKDNSEKASEENDTWNGSISSSYSYHEKGDQLIRIGLGVEIPLFNVDAYGNFITNTGLYVGGAGMIGYSYFLTPEINIGGEVSVTFMTTRGSNTLFFVPFVFRGGYQFNVGKFEIPLDLGLGLAIQTCSSNNYYGLIVRPEVGVYYRYSPEWSFGGNCIWNFMPQWYANKDYTRYGNVMEVSAGIRYHF